MNNEAVTGDVIMATAGGEKGKLFYVIGTGNGLLLLADGKRRKLLSPKRKNRAHTAFVQSGGEMGELLSAGADVSDKQLRRALAAVRRSVRESEPEEVY